MVEERTMWCVLVLIFSLLRESSSTAIPFYIDHTETNWTDAASKCEMVGPGDVLNVTESSFNKLPNLAWIKATASFTQWAQYLGCAVYRSQMNANYRTLSFESNNPFLYCMEECSSSSYFGLQDTRCACFKTIKRPTSPAEVKHACQPKPCKLDHNSLCGDSAKYNNAFVLYKKVKVSVNGTSNCLSAVANTSVANKTTPCNEKLEYICGRTGKKEEANSWENVNKHCDSPFTYDTIKPHAREIWTAYTRRWKIKQQTEENPGYCVAVKVSQDGRMAEYIRKCNRHLPTLCKLTENQESSDQPIATTEVPLIGVAIGLSVVLIIVGVVIVICFSHRKRKQSKMIDDREAHGLADVYAVVKKDHRDSRQVDESPLNYTPSSSNVNGFRMNSTSGEMKESLMNSLQTEDVYDHTDHTLRPQIHEESNYDTMQSTSTELEECENVYNTTNEEMAKGIIVEDDSEYRHLGTTDG